MTSYFTSEICWISGWTPALASALDHGDCKMTAFRVIHNLFQPDFNNNPLDSIKILSQPSKTLQQKCCRIKCRKLCHNQSSRVPSRVFDNRNDRLLNYYQWTKNICKMCNSVEEIKPRLNFPREGNTTLRLHPRKPNWALSIEPTLRIELTTISNLYIKSARHKEPPTGRLG